MNADQAAMPGRDAEAARLTALLEASPFFTYLRLGDGDLNSLLRLQRGEEVAPPDFSRQRDAGPSAYLTTTGRALLPAHRQRLLDAYAHGGYLDTFDLANGPALQELRLDRDPALPRTPEPALSQIFYTWVLRELRGYLARHRCAFAGAESPLLRELLTDPAYRRLASDFIPPDAEPLCLSVPRDGEACWDHVDEIKEALASQLRGAGVHTLFLSLSTAAKIIGHELSTEIPVRVFDIGSLLRALCYAASPGYHTARSSHSPYFFRVPLDIHMAAVRRAYPRLGPLELGLKCHAQMCLDLQERVPGTSLSFKDMNRTATNPPPERLLEFEESFRHYAREYRPAMLKHPDGWRQYLLFRSWLRARRVTPPRVKGAGVVRAALRHPAQTLRHTLQGARHRVAGAATASQLLLQGRPRGAAETRG